MAKEKKFMTCDGNCAAAHVAYMFSEVAAIFIQNCEYQNKYCYVISDSLNGICDEMVDLNNKRHLTLKLQ